MRFPCLLASWFTMLLLFASNGAGPAVAADGEGRPATGSPRQALEVASRSE
jgi:hypothetical protein